MLVRAGLKVWFWGVEIECYQLLDEPRWCLRRPHSTDPAPLDYQLPQVEIEAPEETESQPAESIESADPEAGDQSPA